LPSVHLFYFVDRLIRGRRNEYFDDSVSRSQVCRMIACTSSTVFRLMSDL